MPAVKGYVHCRVHSEELKTTMHRSDQRMSVFKSRRKTYLFIQAFSEQWSDLPPAPLKLRPYGAI